jgi:hypothetical protein
VIYQDISSLMASESIGTLGVNLFWGHMPNTPDTCVVVYEYMGEPPVYSKDAVEWERPRLQVVCRAKTYVEAMQKAEAVFELLSNVKRLTINGTLYDSIRARQRPFADPQGKDDQGRFRVFCNYAIRKAS